MKMGLNIISCDLVQKFGGYDFIIIIMVIVSRLPCYVFFLCMLTNANKLKRATARLIVSVFSGFVKDGIGLMIQVTGPDFSAYTPGSFST